MTDFQVTGEELFKQLHRAIANVQYHNALAGRYEWYGQFQFNMVVLLMVVGLLIAAWPWARLAAARVKRRGADERDKAELRGEVQALLLGFSVTAIGFIISLMPYSNRSLKHGALSDEWTAIRNRIETTQNRLYSLENRAAVPGYIKDDLTAVSQYGNALVAREKEKPDKALQDECWETANEYLYGKGIRTEDQAKERYAELQAQGRIPKFPFGPLPAEQKPQLIGSARLRRKARIAPPVRGIIRRMDPDFLPDPKKDYPSIEIDSLTNGTVLFQKFPVEPLTPITFELHDFQQHLLCQICAGLGLPKAIVGSVPWRVTPSEVAKSQLYFACLALGCNRCRRGLVYDERDGALRGCRHLKPLIAVVLRWPGTADLVRRIVID